MSHYSGRPVQALVERMAQAAASFLGSLDPAQRETAAFPFPGDPERSTWFYTPTDHGGLSLAGMDGAQQQLAHRLLATGLSERGYNTAAVIMGLENVLDLREGFRARFARRELRARDPNLYYLSIFGEPGAEKGWGWRFGGHHISVNYTLVGSQPAHLPLFFGANPASAPLGTQVLRPLGPEMDLAHELLNALDAPQQRRAIISPAAPLDIVTGNRPSVEAGARSGPLWELMREPADPAALPAMRQAYELQVTALGLNDELQVALALPEQPVGVTGLEMHLPARIAFARLLNQFTLRLPDEIAEREAQRLGGEALDDMFFAWAGSPEPGQPHYWRIHGPGVLIEYDCVQDSANHIHTVWRDPLADFGRDLLAEHYRDLH
jgi:hypothetical protein